MDLSTRRNAFSVLLGLWPALFRLGERESGTDKLEEAVAAYREALKENTRERVPLEWASGSPTPIAAARTGAPGTRRIAITRADSDAYSVGDWGRRLPARCRGCTDPYGFVAAPAFVNSLETF